MVPHFQKHLLHVGEPKLAETPLLEARSLATAVRMMAAAHELPKDAGSALDTVAYIIQVALTPVAPIPAVGRAAA